MRPAVRRLSVVALGLGLLLPTVVRGDQGPPSPAEESGAAPASAPEPSSTRTSCVICHTNPELFDPDEIRTIEATDKDAHGRVGLSCHDCHGGNPDPALAENADAAMDEHYAPSPFVGAPERRAIPEFCGHCHADAEYMKRYKPELRVDQLQEYRTSRHGELLAQGDTKVATCIDCHGAHGILAPSAPDSPVYPTHVAKTCAKCHADPKHMAGYTLAGGRPLPTDQYAQWQRSVHARALLEKGDFSAPTCNDCHGNHGATPPGIESASFVCGQCHGREADLFRKSEKHAGFQDHNDYLADGSTCADCHEESEVASRVTDVHRFTECATCHGNHAIVSPRITMLAPLPPTPCAFCHEPGPGGAPVPEAPGVLEHYHQVRDALVERARASGLSDTALFDQLVDDAQQLPFHSVQASQGARELRPEFRRLFQKFRLGKTYFTYRDPVTGQEVRQPVVRCNHCHGGAKQGPGAAVALQFLNGLHAVTASTARAERISLRARRGGVSTRKAQEAIDRSVDAQIQMQVLLHSFQGGKEGPFAVKQAEGLADANQALEAGQAALGELRFRRRGLGASLAIIVLVLVGLALKIRSLGQ
jgi:hypothetical protein